MVSSIIGAIALFSVLVPTLVKSLEVKQRVYIGIIGSYSLDTLPPQITTLVSSGLTTLDEAGNVSPLVASRMSIEDDGQTYRFIIRDDLRWQDGKGLSPEDIQYNLQNTEVVTTRNDIIFKLPAPFAPFPSVVAKPLLRRVDQSYRLLFTRPNYVGLGEYLITDYKQENNQLTEITIDGTNERRIYRFYFSEDDLVLAFKHGEIDVIEDLSNPHGFETWPNVTVETTLRTDRYLGLFFNNNSPLFPKNIRQALSYAMTKPNDDTRAIGPINPNSWAYLEGGKGYEYDIERAIERILDDLPNQVMEINLTTTTEFQSEAEQIKLEWEEFFAQAKEACNNSSNVDDKSRCDNLNGKVNIRITNFPDLNDFDAILIGQEIPVDPDQYALWHSDQPTNFTGFQNTRIDALLERGRTTVDQSSRTEIYQEFQQFFLEDAPAVFIKHLFSHEVRRN